MQDNYEQNQQDLLKNYSGPTIGPAKDIPERLPFQNIGPNRDLLAPIQNFIYSSEPGRKLMDATSKINEFLGGPQQVFGNIGNVAPGAIEAVTPALEKLVNEGIISKAANLFGKNRGYFLDKMGDIYDLGDITSEKFMTHPDVMSLIGKDITSTSSMEKALNELDLIRLRRQSYNNQNLAIHATNQPSNAAMEQLTALFEQQPKTNVALDLSKVGSNIGRLSKIFTNPSEAMDAIYKFFGK